jgi:predicted CoA-binding protein
MELFEGDFVYLSNHLKIMDYRMVLVNPKFAQPEVHKSEHALEPLNDSISEVQSVDEERA